MRKKTKKTEVWKSILELNTKNRLLHGAEPQARRGVYCLEGARRTQRNPMASRARQASENPGLSASREDDRRASAADFHDPPRNTYSFPSAGPCGFSGGLAR